MYPYQRTPIGNLTEISKYKPYITWVFMGHNPQESQVEHQLNTMVVHIRERGPHPSKSPFKYDPIWQESLDSPWINGIFRDPQ